MPLLPLRKVVPDTDALADDINQIIDALQDITAGHDHNGSAYFGKPVDHDHLVHAGTYKHDRVGTKGYSLDQVADFARGVGAIDSLYNIRVKDGAYKVQTATIQLTECWKFSEDNTTTGLHSDFQKVVSTGFTGLIAVYAHPLGYPGLNNANGNTVVKPNNAYNAAPQSNFWNGLTILTSGLSAGQFCVRVAGWSGWRHGWSVGNDPCHTDGWNHHLVNGSPDSDLLANAPYVYYIAIGA